MILTQIQNRMLECIDDQLASDEEGRGYFILDKLSDDQLAEVKVFIGSFAAERATTEKKKIYLAGPMRGLPLFNYPAFTQGAAALRAAGFYVFNPAEADTKRTGKNAGDLSPNGDEAEAAANGFDLRAALGEDLAFICHEADAVALLPGWSRSRGACAEKATAEALGLDVIYLEEKGDTYVM